MPRVRLAAAALVLVGAYAVTGVVGAPSASASSSCQLRDETTLDSGVSRASAFLHRCWDGAQYWWSVSGYLYDTACDNRSAYLDIYNWPGGAQPPPRASGCNTSVYYSFATYTRPGTIELRTRACNFSCSSEDRDWLYP
jgi:hypothetical protein